jgi:ElaB/YqjD/DUF883 family membrane-anchored ribosome-binding protein
MEEGPEPHEGIERMVEHHHHEHEHASGGKSSDMLLGAVTAAVLAVCAAIGSLLSGHAANEAILSQSKANDQWGLYQAKSVKWHIYEANQELLDTLAALQRDRPDQIQAKLEDFRRRVEKYDQDKEASRTDAEKFDAASEHEFRKHQWYSFGVAAFQIGIVLASISLLVRGQRTLFILLYGLSLAAGLSGLGLLAVGALPQLQALLGFL